MNREEIRRTLEEMAEPDYARFARSLLPGVETVLGVRLPALRRLARRIARDGAAAYLRETPGPLFEEQMLRGMVIGCMAAGTEERMAYVAEFVPSIDSWSVCDSFCSSLKAVLDDRERWWRFLVPYLEDERTYCVRFGVVMLLTYYRDEAYIDRVLERLRAVRHGAYYARMAVGWAVALCFARFPQRTYPLLAAGVLDDQTRGMALRKILDSRQIPPEQKACIRAMR